MYRDFFDLKDEPFRLTPDPSFLHFSEPHQAALTTLLEGIFYRKGLVMITGPVGTGKTTLVHTALQIISGKNQKIPTKSALLFNPTLTRDEFLEMMLEEFEVSCSATSKPRRLIALHQMLIETQRQGGTAVLIIDEAHLLSTELLEEIRLLGNSDMHGEKLLQIVLCGQPELLAIMNRREMSALRQRIAARGNMRLCGGAIANRRITGTVAFLRASLGSCASVFGGRAPLDQPSLRQLPLPRVPHATSSHSA
jgi:general secretion pathway protein A